MLVVRRTANILNLISSQDSPTQKNYSLVNFLACRATGQAEIEYNFLALL